MQAKAMVNKLEGTICKGIEQAIGEYQSLSQMPEIADVAPKEDQIKCGIYHACQSHGLLVHVEGGRGRNNGRLDLKVIDTSGRKPVAAAIEIKVAHAGNGWVNKAKEQDEKWRLDIKKLKMLDDPAIKARYFVLLFAYQNGFEHGVREKIRGLRDSARRVCEAKIPYEIEWRTGLDRLSYFVFSVPKGRWNRRRLG